MNMITILKYTESLKPIIIHSLQTSALYMALFMKNLFLFLHNDSCCSYTMSYVVMISFYMFFAVE